MNWYKLSLFYLFTLFTITTIEAKTYTGRVINSETEAGLAGVSITLLNSDEKATTDQDGQFSISAELSVKSNHFRLKEYNLLHWQSASHLFDLRSAPLVRSIAIYNLKGERLFFKERAPGIDKITCPSLPKNIYLLCMETQNDALFSAKWVDLGNSVSFSFSGRDKVGSLSKQSSVVSALVLEKQGYQTKQTDIDSDSANTAMLIKLKPEIGFGIFNDDTVRTYKLYFTSGDIAKLLDFSKLVTGTYTVNAIFVPARLEFEGRKLDSIGVRFRGDQSLWDCVANGARKKNVKYPQFGFGNNDICAKFSMKFDFNRYNKDQRFVGLKALNFRSMSADPTKMHEKLGYSIFTDMGVDAPRAAYAKLYVNDTLWGLFGVAEEIDSRFTKSRYPKSGDGNLYSALWPETQATDAAILDALETNNDPEDNPDISDFKKFRDTVTAAGTTADNFLEKCKMIVDIPQFVRYLVVDRGIANFDGIMSAYVSGNGHMRHNYCWYHDEESGLFKIIPWDLDKVFIYPEPNFWTNNAPSANAKLPNWNVVNSTYTNISCSFDPGSGGGTYKVEPIDKDKFLKLIRTATWNDFGNQGKVFLDSIFTETKLNKRIANWRALIARAVGEDPTIDSTEWATMVDSLSHTIPLLRKNLEMMMDTLITK